MTDRRDDRLERRLEAWFDEEVTRAGHDLVARPVRGSRERRGAAPRLALYVAAAVITVVAVGGTMAVGFRTQTDDRVPPSTRPSGTPIPTPPTQPQVGADVDVTGWYWDGVPASIEGVPVARPTEFRGPGRNTGTALVGGWVGTEPCPVAATACDAALAEASDGDPVTRVSTTDAIPPVGSIAVYRVIRGAGTLVWSVDPKAFVDDRLPDGIPAHLGDVVVHPVSELATVLDRTPDDRPILVGGWVGGRIPLRCPAPPPDRREHPLLPWCNGARIEDHPHDRFLSKDDGTAIVLDGLNLPAGRVVLRVHHRDARSGSCVPEQRDLCEDAIVVEAVAWSGDEWTETTPLTITDVVDRLRNAELARNVIALTTTDDVGGCRPDFPPETWVPSGYPTATSTPVGRILVFATVADRERVGETLRTDGFSGRGPDGMSCRMIVDGLTAQAWVAVENVIVEVPYLVDEDAAETRGRIDAVEAALRGD